MDIIEIILAIGMRTTVIISHLVSDVNKELWSDIDHFTPKTKYEVL